MIGRIISIFTDRTFIKFILVGVVNTLIGTTIMFVSYNLLHFSYWISSAANYFFDSICSYLLNKYFTFRYHEHGWSSLVRFTINIVTCYLLAYGMARPFMHWLLSGYSLIIRDNVSMTFGMCLFVVFNYLGQRFFAFKKTER